MHATSLFFLPAFWDEDRARNTNTCFPRSSYLTPFFLLFFVRLVFFCSSPLSSPLFLFFFARLPLSIGAGNGQQYGPWGAAFNGETSLPLMPKSLPRKKTTNTCLPKRLRFQISKVAFNLVLGILVILQSCPWLKYNWILAFRHLLQTSP